jgi:hypothetical protein
MQWNVSCHNVTVMSQLPALQTHDTLMRECCVLVCSFMTASCRHSAVQQPSQPQEVTAAATAAVKGLQEPQISSSSSHQTLQAALVLLLLPLLQPLLLLLQLLV